jgi:hypothetical protein
MTTSGTVGLSVFVVIVTKLLYFSEFLEFFKY